MIREVWLRVYNFFVSRFFLFMRLFPLKNTVVILTTFGDNVEYLIREEKMRYYDEIIIFTDRNFNFSKFNNVSIYKHHNISLKELYEISRAKNIVLDNYFPVLGGMTTLKPYVNVFQTWHAVGAVKAFGLCDLTLNHRPEIAKKRFRKTYQNVDYYLAGSSKMANILKRVFDLDDSKILDIGMPRVDFYSNQSRVNQTNHKIRTELNIQNNKKIITYAPTYRENQFNITDIPLDVKTLLSQLPDDYTLVLRLHPAVQLDIKLDNIIDMSNNYSLEEVLSITDILITDYSSIGFEFANLERPIIFYPYDLDEYTRTKGLIDEYENLVTSNIAESTNDIIKLIKENNFSLDEIQSFKTKWNEHSNGFNANLLSRVLK